MKSIDTLPQDIYDLFTKEDVEFKEEDVQEFGHTLAKIIQRRISETRDNKGTLRMSNLGWPDRKLWYHVKGAPQEELPPHARFKFLYGDIIEELVLFLAKQAGHKVEGEQGTHKMDGIVGHRDAVVDGTLIDVKSAAPFSFKQFKEGLTEENDKFGYIRQLDAYRTSESEDGVEFDKDEAKWVVVDKTLGHIIVADAPKPAVPTKEIIEHKKAVVESVTTPERCYPAVPEGKSGNMKLGVECSYCPFKHECWKDSNGGKGLRTFIYSYGPVYLTKVSKEPNVTEVTT